VRAKRRSILLRCYDLDFDRIALNAKLTHEEKIRLLVQMQHIWTDGKTFFIDEGLRYDVIQAEILAFRPEIEHRLAVVA
jgi:hypothetical protein